LKRKGVRIYGVSTFSLLLIPEQSPEQGVGVCKMPVLTVKRGVSVIGFLLAKPNVPKADLISAPSVTLLLISSTTLIALPSRFFRFSA